MIKRGAYAHIQYLDDLSEGSGYFSLGSIMDDPDIDACDSFGVPDHEVFYYLDSEEDMEELKDSKYDFKVLSYEWAYADEVQP